MEPTPANAIADWGDGSGGREVNTADAANLRNFLTWGAQLPTFTLHTTGYTVFE